MLALAGRPPIILILKGCRRCGGDLEWRDYDDAFCCLQCSCRHYASPAQTKVGSRSREGQGYWR